MSNATPNEKKIEQINDIRNVYKEVIECMDLVCLDSEELDVALEYLQTSLMWAVKSIVLN